jgi:hypothetical protein
MRCVGLTAGIGRKLRTSASRRPENLGHAQTGRPSAQFCAHAELERYRENGNAATTEKRGVPPMPEILHRPGKHVEIPYLSRRQGALWEIPYRSPTRQPPVRHAPRSVASAREASRLLPTYRQRDLSRHQQRPQRVAGRRTEPFGNPFDTLRSSLQAPLCAPAFEGGGVSAPLCCRPWRQERTRRLHVRILSAFRPQFVRAAADALRKPNPHRAGFNG